MTPLNLASRPFRNDRLPTLAFALGTSLVLALTAWHALALRRVLPTTGSTMRAEAAALDAELEALEDEESRLLSVRAAPDRVDEWREVQALVDQRVFAWTALLGRLESLLPAGVRLESITPSLDDGEATLDLQAHARTLDDGLALWQALLDSGEFPDALQTSVDEREDGIAVTYSMRYAPRAPEAATAAEVEAVGEPAGPAAEDAAGEVG